MYNRTPRYRRALLLAGGNGRVDHAPDGTPLSFPGVLIDVEERRAVEAERDRVAAALRSLNETLEQRVAEVGDSGRAQVLQSELRIDLLITDVGLPGGMNGRQMADAGRERRPDLKVLFITGYAENSVLNNGHLAPFMVLTKPFAVDVLAARIKELVAR